MVRLTEFGRRVPEPRLDPPDELGLFDVVDIDPAFKTFVYCTCQVEGYHYWPKAPQNHVYLGNTHRHMFHCRAYVSVYGDNREVEFIELKEFVEEALDGITGTKSIPTDLSCEQMAKEVITDLVNMYGEDRIYIVTVSEDDENGAYVQYEPQPFGLYEVVDSIKTTASGPEGVCEGCDEGE